jgi:hypothetical protein
MLAMTRKCPPHCWQVSMSMANTRLRRCAHDIARCRSLTDTCDGKVQKSAESGEADRIPGIQEPAGTHSGCRKERDLKNCSKCR